MTSYLISNRHPPSTASPLGRRFHRTLSLLFFTFILKSTIEATIDYRMRFHSRERGPTIKKIIHFLRVEAPPNAVYSALTTKEGLEGWWSKKVNVDPGVGGILDFRFMEGFNPDMKVTALEENEAVQWTCVGGHEN